MAANLGNYLHAATAAVKTHKIILLQELIRWEQVKPDARGARELLHRLRKEGRKGASLSNDNMKDGCLGSLFHVEIGTCR